MAKSDPVVSPADTIRRDFDLLQAQVGAPVGYETSQGPLGRIWRDRAALLAVGERDKAEREQAEKEAAELRQALIVQERQWLAASQAVGADERDSIDRDAAKLILLAIRRGDEFWQEQLQHAFDLTIAEAKALAAAVLAGEEDARS